MSHSLIGPFAESSLDEDCWSRSIKSLFVPDVDVDAPREKKEIKFCLEKFN